MPEHEASHVHLDHAGHDCIAWIRNLQRTPAVLNQKVYTARHEFSTVGACYLAKLSMQRNANATQQCVFA